MIPKMYLCVADKTHYSEKLRYAYLDKNDFVATDGHLLIKHSSPEIFDPKFFEVLGDEAVLLSYDCLKAMNLKNAKYELVKHVDGGNTNFRIHIIKNKTDVIKLFELKTVKIKASDYVNYDVVIPDSNKIVPLDKIAITARLLYNLQQAIDPTVEHVILTFTGQSSAMIVELQGSKYKNYKAILMPRAITTY